MIITKNINEARKEIQKLVREGKKVIVEAGDENFNRKIFEMNDVDMVVGLEIGRIDKLKQRDSGVNEVIAKLAKKNDIIIVIDIDKIKKLGLVEKGKVLARIKQNINLCKRTEARIILLNASPNEAMSFILSLGGNTQQGLVAYFDIKE
jgi:RNase P/RNase MRP subunit p30